MVGPLVGVGDVSLDGVRRAAGRADRHLAPVRRATQRHTVPRRCVANHPDHE